LDAPAAAPADAPDGEDEGVSGDERTQGGVRRGLSAEVPRWSRYRHGDVIGGTHDAHFGFGAGLSSCLVTFEYGMR